MDLIHFRCADSIFAFRLCGHFSSTDDHVSSVCGFCWIPCSVAWQFLMKFQIISQYRYVPGGSCIDSLGVLLHPLLCILAISGEIQILVAISVVPGGSSFVSLLSSAQSCGAPVLSPGFMIQLLCFHQTRVAGAPLAPVLCSLETSGVIPIKLLPCSED